MKKEVSYALVVALLAIVVVVFYYIGGGPTGYAVLSEYENQTTCEGAGYVWQNLTEQNCTIVTTCINETIDCEPCLEYEDINGTQGDCINWSSCIEPSCTDEEECVDVVIGAQCIGDVCGADFLELCLDETNCIGAGGYWYNDVCNAEVEPSCSNDLTLCDETNCIDVGSGYWYDDVCNSDECESDAQCDSGYECSAGSCVAIEEEDADEVETPEENKTEEIITEIIPMIAALNVDNIQDIKLNPGSSQKVPVVVKNTGTKNLISCVVKPVGEFSSWILVPEGTTNINLGGQYEFSFDVIVPEETEENPYLLSVSVECSEKAEPKDFTVNVEKKKLEFDLISADRTRDDRVRVLYSLEELSGNDQDVVFTFSLIDVNNVEVGRVEANQSIDANASDEFKTNININESLLPINKTTNKTLESELTLNINFNSQIYSSSIQEKVLIGAPIGGFAIFEDVGAGEAVIFVVVLFVLVFIFIFARRMRRKGKTLKDLVKGKSSGST